MSLPPQKKLKVSSPSGEESAEECEASSSRLLHKESTRDEDWRSTHWKTRSHYALKNNFLCDVTFVVGLEGENEPVESFPAHKLIMALASPVFEAMFYGQLAEKGECVTITDLAPDTFETLLKCIYTSQVPSDGSIESLLRLYTAADKYCMPQIKARCAKLFSNMRLSSSNVWSALQSGLFLDLQKVVDKCHAYLEKETESALLSEDINIVSTATMQDFLCMNVLHASELSLLLALVKWGEAKREGRTLQDTVKPCLGHIRFGALTTLEFCEFLDQAKVIMSDADSLAILKHLTKPKSYPLPDWCTTKSWSRIPFVIPELGNDNDSDSSTSSSSSSSSTSDSWSSSDSSDHSRRLRRRVVYPAGVRVPVSSDDEAVPSD